MKKIVSITFFLILVLMSFAGCGEKANPKVETIVLSQNSVSLTEGDSVILEYSVLPQNATCNISWKSLNTEIAKVDQNGKISAISAGQTNIIATDTSGAGATCSVVVNPQKAYLKLNKYEKEFVDTFAKSLHRFKNPSSVTVKGIQYISTESSWEILGKWQVYVSAQNGFGGNSSTLYMLSKDGNISEALLQYELVGGTYVENGIAYGYNLNLINEALKEKAQ